MPQAWAAQCCRGPGVGRPVRLVASCQSRQLPAVARFRGNHSPCDPRNVVPVTRGRLSTPVTALCQTEKIEPRWPPWDAPGGACAVVRLAARWCPVMALRAGGRALGLLRGRLRLSGPAAPGGCAGRGQPCGQPCGQPRGQSRLGSSGAAVQRAVQAAGAEEAGEGTSLRAAFLSGAGCLSPGWFPPVAGAMRSGEGSEVAAVSRLRRVAHSERVASPLAASQA